MARPKSKKEWNIFDRDKRGIWYIDLRKAGGKLISSNLEANKANLKLLENEVVPLLLQKLKGTATEEELKEKIKQAKNAHTVAVFGKQSLGRHGFERQSHIQHAYELVFVKHILPYFGKKNIADIDGLQLMDWQNTINAKTGFSTLKKCKVVLSQMFDDAIIARIILSSPLLGVKLPKRIKEEREIKPFNLQEIGLLLNNATGYFKNVIGLMFFTGMRPSEIAALEWSNISFETCTISVKKTLKRDRTIGQVKTKSSKREIELLPQAIELLQEQFKQTGLKAQMVFESKIYKQGFTSIDYWQRAFQNLLKKCNIESRNLYQCRHTFASQMLNNGEDLLWVSHTLGHKSADITLKVYAKYIKTERKERGKWLNFSHNFSHTKDFTKEEVL